MTVKLTDLTEAYRTYFLQEDNQRAYEAQHPELFAHYRQFWSVADREYLRLSEEQLADNRRLILERLPFLEARFAAVGLDTSHLELILMVGQGTSNGHGMLTPHGTAAWLDIEGYSSLARIDTFVTHEIAHALHYQSSRGFYFRNRIEQKAPLRQLITEGLATYVTRRVLDCDGATALWADFLEPAVLDDWMQLCRGRIAELAELLLDAHHTGAQTEMFYANEPDDILKFRSGYFLGLSVIETLASASDHDLADLLTEPRVGFEPRVMRLLMNPGGLTAVSR